MNEVELPYNHANFGEMRKPYTAEIRDRDTFQETPDFLVDSDGL